MLARDQLADDGRVGACVGEVLGGGRGGRMLLLLRQLGMGYPRAIMRPRRFRPPRRRTCPGRKGRDEVCASVPAREALANYLGAEGQVGAAAGAAEEGCVPA